MRLKLGLVLATLFLAACTPQPEPAPVPRTGSPNLQSGQPANPDSAIRPSTRGRN